MADILRRVELPVRCHGHALRAEIDAETALWLFDFRRRDRDRDMQVEVPFAIGQFGGTGFARAKLFAHPGRHLQPACDAAFGTDRQRSGLKVRTKSHLNIKYATSDLRETSVLHAKVVAHSLHPKQSFYGWSILRKER